MGSTVDNSRNAQFQMQDTVERLKREIDGLAKQRKDQGLFLRVKAERAELEKIKADAEQIKESATNQAMQIVSRAKLESDGIREQAFADREMAKKYSQRVVREAKNKERLVDMQQELSTKRAVAVTKMEDVFKRAVDEHEVKIGNLKGKALRLKKAIIDFVCE